MSSDFIRDHILSMNPYQPIVPLDVLADQLGFPIDELVKMDANENPYGMPPASKKRLENLSYGHIYPDPESRYLRGGLSEFLQIPTNNIVAGAGADELIDLIIRLTMNPGDKIINCPPTFGFYDAVAQVHNLQILNVKRKPDFSLDFQIIQKGAQKGAKLIFLANPNNPDGGLVSPELLIQILSLPLLVVLDEAYIEFAKPNESMASEVLKRDNLVVLRTFSKWGGLAGLRLGYGIFPEVMVKEIMKIKQPYNVSVAASEAGLGALEDIAILNERRDLILTERGRMTRELEKFNFLFPYRSFANFILCKVINRDAKKLKDDLSKRGILIRYFNKPGLEDHVRFSVSKPEDTDRLLTALKELTS